MEQSVPPENKPQGVVFITNKGVRIPIHLKLKGVGNCGMTGHNLCNIWEPVIEGDLTRLLPLVVAMDAEHWPHGSHLAIEPGPGYMTPEWGINIVKNSPCLQSYSATEDWKHVDLFERQQNPSIIELPRGFEL